MTTTTLADVFDQAVRLHQGGKLAQAEALYRQVLEADADHPAAHHLLGLLAHQAGNHEAAIALVRRAVTLAPADAGCRFNLGIILMSQGRAEEAVACYRDAIRLSPGHVQAYNNLGNALQTLGKPADAEVCYREALRRDSRNANAHYNLGNSLRSQGKTQEAVGCYRQALVIDPAHAAARMNLDALLREQANDHHARSVELTRTGDIPGALAEAEQACQLAPQDEMALCQRALVRILLGDIEGGKDDYEQVLRLNPRNNAVLWSRGLLRLLDGDYERGWQDYEYRWTQPGHPRRYQDVPRWDGSDLTGKTIFVHAEQGLGDTLQFIRYLPMVKERGGTVLFGCQPALMGLCSRAEGLDRLIAPGAEVPPFDVEAPLLSLPGIFKATLASIPAKVPYLRAEQAKVDYWRQELAAIQGFKVGIVWEGSAKNKGNRLRSLPLACFEGLARLEGVKLVSLQVGQGAEQLASAGFPIVELGSRFDPTSLDDLAAALLNVDLFVTVETAPAHLAGALGVRTWTLVPVSPDWRWLRERDDSPWYPTMRLFRQKQFGNWSETIDEVVVELEQRLSAKNEERRTKN